MGIYTKKGDKGETSLYGGSRVGKDAPRVWVYGTIDEANSILGVVHATIRCPRLKDVVRKIQQKLFILSAEIASDEKGLEKLEERLVEHDIVYLEHFINKGTKIVGQFTGFTIPGETAISGFIHLARTVVRRAERHLVEVSRTEAIPPYSMQFLNRLSDALYVLAKREVFANFIFKVMDKLEETAGNSSSVPGPEILDGELCNALCFAAGEESERIKVPVSIAITDRGGRLVFFFRYPQASLVSVGIAQKKAYTAVAMEQPSGNILQEALPDGTLFG
jgi:ATP:cob(I)alamin adenosyltransferase